MNSNNRSFQYLFIDDDEISNFLVESIAEKLDIAEQSRFLDDAPAALKYLEEVQQSASSVPPRFIFLDLNMPLMGGFEFLDEYESRNYHKLYPTRIYILSSSVSPSDIKRSKEYNTVNGFISKPLKTDELKKIIQ
ncbi:MAG: response regulator [Cyclobacteriaceae bacterium]